MMGKFYRVGLTVSVKDGSFVIEGANSFWKERAEYLKFCLAVTDRERGGHYDGMVTLDVLPVCAIWKEAENEGYLFFYIETEIIDPAEICVIKFGRDKLEKINDLFLNYHLFFEKGYRVGLIAGRGEDWEIVYVRSQRFINRVTESRINDGTDHRHAGDERIRREDLKDKQRERQKDELKLTDRQRSYLERLLRENGISAGVAEVILNRLNRKTGSLLIEELKSGKKDYLQTLLREIVGIREQKDEKKMESKMEGISGCGNEDDGGMGDKDDLRLKKGEDMESIKEIEKKLDYLEEQDIKEIDEIDEFIDF